MGANLIDAGGYELRYKRIFAYLLRLIGIRQPNNQQ